jgi:cytochrome d ubiquinol oxidase subunit II
LRSIPGLDQSFLSFAGLGLMVFPAIIPPSVTIFEAHASVSSLVFMLTFIGVLIPIMLFYNIYNYVAFSGKVPHPAEAE